MFHVEQSPGNPTAWQIVSRETSFADTEATENLIQHIGGSLLSDDLSQLIDGLIQVNGGQFAIGRGLFYLSNPSPDSGKGLLQGPFVAHSRYGSVDIGTVVFQHRGAHGLLEPIDPVPVAGGNRDDG